MSIVIYAEKPDIGKKIAAALDCITLADGKKVSYDQLSANDKAIKAQQFKDGYLEIRFAGEQTFVTWGYGHLCELKSAKDYNADYQQWKKIPIPFIPRPYDIKVKDDAKKQFRVVKNLIDKSSLVINATDDDREGEVIFFYLMKAIKTNKPFKRARYSSIEKKAFIEAFNDLKEPETVKNITDAGRSRSIADWVVGCNLTVAMSLKYSGGKVLSIGRVQTPTLNILVERELAIQNFQPEPYYVIKALFETTKRETYEATSLRKQIKSKEEAESVYKSLIGKNGIVKSVDFKEEYKSAPMLYNLSALQVAANTKYGFTLAETLDIAQSLYEAGYTTYPRSDSRYLTEDMEPVVNNVLDALALSSPEYKALINGKARFFDRKRYFDNSKVSSHYAIIPTTTTPTDLTPRQQKIYDLIARSVIMMIYPKALIKKTTVVTNVGEERFSSTGSVVVTPGWMSVDKVPDEKLLPDLTVGETVTGEYSLLEKETQPPKRFDDAALVEEMKIAGKKIEDEELRKVMLDSGNTGIGTEATRASIVETLITRAYAAREGKYIVPTEKGIALINALPLKEIKSAELTAIWEERLENIAAGKDDMTSFLRDIEAATKEWCDVVVAAEKEDSFALDGVVSFACPGCGSPVVSHKWGYGCSNYKNGCKFAINNTIASKKLTDKQIKLLATEGTTGEKPLAGFVGKSGKKFSAVLNFDFTIKDGLVSESKISFVFPDTHSAISQKPVPSELHCPACGAAISNGKWAWECSKKCGFSLGYKVAGRAMSENELKDLVKNGETRPLRGFTSKKGAPFTATLRLSDDNKGAMFVFPKY